jgi:hypothetical protein
MTDEEGTLLANPLLWEVVIDTGGTFILIFAELAVRQSRATYAFVLGGVVLPIDALWTWSRVQTGFAALNRICAQFTDPRVDVEGVTVAFRALRLTGALLAVGVGLGTPRAGGIVQVVTWHQAFRTNGRGRTLHTAFDLVTAGQTLPMVQDVKSRLTFSAFILQGTGETVAEHLRTGMTSIPVRVQWVWLAFETVLVVDAEDAGVDHDPAWVAGSLVRGKTCPVFALGANLRWRTLQTVRETIGAGHARRTVVRQMEPFGAEKTGIAWWAFQTIGHGLFTRGALEPCIDVVPVHTGETIRAIQTNLAVWDEVGADLTLALTIGVVVVQTSSADVTRRAVQAVLEHLGTELALVGGVDEVSLFAFGALFSWVALLAMFKDRGAGPAPATIHEEGGGSAGEAVILG